MKKLPLRDFLAALAERLEGLTKEELAALLLARAKELPARERVAFLDGFRPLPESWPSLRPPGVGGDFLAEVRGYAERVRGEAYVTGQGGDDEIRDRRTYGDASWAGELEDLLTEARACDRAARLLAAAAEAYSGRGEAPKGRALLAAYDERYRRHTAFRKELKAAARSGGFAL